MHRFLAVATVLVVALSACGTSGTPGNYRKGTCGAVEAGTKSLDHLGAAVAALDADDAATLAEQVELARIDAHVVSGQISYVPRNWGPGDDTRRLLTTEVQQPLDNARALLPDPRAGEIVEAPQLDVTERAELDRLMDRVRAGLRTARESLSGDLGIDCSSAAAGP
jgi:hypothetical protein